VLRSLLALALLGGVASADNPADSADSWTFHPGGYVQSQFRLRQNSAVPGDEDGFRLARVRLTGTAAGKLGDLDLSATIEAEAQPTFALADAFATVSHGLPSHGTLAFDAGQMRVPISRQNLLSDSRLSFVDKAQLATIAPDRDLGGRLTLVTPGAPVRVIAGLYNGEGRNQVQNINESYLYAGRVEVTPLGGPTEPNAESAFAKAPWVAMGLSAGLNKLTPGEYRDDVLYLGGDVSGSFAGLSGSAELLIVRHDFRGNPAKLPGEDYEARGWMTQLAYLLPLTLPPADKLRIEVGARIEEIDRNDTVPIPQPGDPNQSVREYTGVVTAYLREHTLKAQLAFNHFQEIEDRTSTGQGAKYANDQLLLQVTYRVE
jgi:hypothetical protein